MSPRRKRAESAAVVTPELLQGDQGPVRQVKILGSSNLTKTDVTAHRFSKSALDKITAAGGTATASAGTVLAECCFQGAESR
jgi:large subunit ribosomal protein L15